MEEKEELEEKIKQSKKSRPDSALLLKLFVTTFTASMFTFGGGYVIVGIMKKKFVDQLKWIDDEEMLDIIALASSCPGPMAVNTSVMLGFKLAGIIGSVVTLVATVLPPLIVVSILSVIYSAVRDNYYVGLVLRGMRIGVAAVIADVVIGMIIPFVKKKSVFSLIILAIAFVVTTFLKVNVIAVIIVAGIVGALTLLRKDKEAAK